MADDFMDNADTRRGALCWHKLKNCDSLINDLLFLLNGIFAILKKHFSNHHCYVPAIELFHDCALKVTIGQVMDLLSLKDGRPNFDFFTIDNYNALAKYKTAYFALTFPLSLAMHLANLYDSKLHELVNTISMEAGLFFQIQNDYLDCYGDPKRTGKDSNDIREGKFTWLSTVALQRANLQQRKIMEEYYGKSGEVAIIKNLYEELNLPELYAMYQEESYKIACEHIEKLPKGFQHEFHRLIDIIYKKKD